MTKPNEEILNRLENHLSAPEAMQVLTICNEYLDEERNKIKAKAVNGICDMIEEYRTAVLSKNETNQKKLGNKLDMTIKKIKRING